MSIPEITTFCIYLFGMLTVGIIFYRITGNISDYVLGGRRLGGSVAALSAVALQLGVTTSSKSYVCTKLANTLSVSLTQTM